MRPTRTLATTFAVLLLARSVAAQDVSVGNASAAVPPLDRFTAAYGYPTFPFEPEYQVPYVWNGPDYNALRIGDLTKIPTINEAAKSPSAPAASSHRPGFIP